MKKICCICGEAREINLLIRGKMICSSCELRIVQSRLCDKARYDALMNKIREQIPVETKAAALQ